ncbi:hypothetical protein AVEN_248033-1 [Araneus ventricosus]|uniref:Uncharacterized protein n=1 Tax=Araneus ventricosus TaxID=182803 RepID=A0A4Y2STV0_ARAVE|nr:hypothetical protein AVEN_248033-1 [Araneus ventricosus]
MLIDDFLSLDYEAETSETLTELDILDSVKNKNNTAINCDEDDADGNDYDAEINKPSYDEMLKSFETIRLKPYEIKHITFLLFALNSLRTIKALC